MLDEIDVSRPIPPEIVYKFVSADRIDVLRNATIRFTPPLNTNDIFEVRQTFEMLAGPKMKELFASETANININETIVNAVKDTPLSGLPPDLLRNVFESATGNDLEEILKTTVVSLVENTIYPMLNSSETMGDLLLDLSNKLICLSLSERFDSSPMWAHYAQNSTGFVIAFDSRNGFFRRGNQDEHQGLHKIAYFDGKIAELMDDPFAALISKQKDWAYEREWRLYLKENEASETLKIEEDIIHLVNFPKVAVQRVILGLRASEELEASLKEIIRNDYPTARLTRLRADRETATLIEMSVE